MKALFLTFGDGSPDFRAAAERLATQARSTGIFSLSTALNNEMMLNISSEYRLAQHSMESLDIYPRYFRAAKAWVIHAGLLGKFGDFEVICYADAGCEIVNNAISNKVLLKNLKRALSEGGLSEQIPHPERLWTKNAVLDYFQVSNSDACSGQIQSTISYWRVDGQNIDLSSRWCLLSDSEQNLWQDPSNLSDESHDFKAHRHDQSIFSILWKQSKYPITPANSQWSKMLPELRSACIPIQARRNRTGSSILPRTSGSKYLAGLGFLINFAFTHLGKSFFGKKIKMLRHRYKSDSSRRA
jgi:hypothetical protein